MGILRLGSQIGQTVKNVARLKTILVVMGRHGLAEIAERMRLDRLIPGFKFKRIEGDRKLTLPERVRLTFEELGPTFVKLGQVLSTRPDLIPHEYAEEFKKLQDRVPPVPFELVKKTIESEFRRPLSEIYKTFDENPLAAASIAQVHEATLLDGSEVVVKVQRPGIDKLIDTDVSILFVIAGLLEKYIEESRIFNPMGIVEEFFKTLKTRLNINIKIVLV
jgi:ubiquinone biosynthesis protein